MDVADVVRVLLHGNQLKRSVRTGWAQRGVSNPEDVAAHSYGVVFITLVLSQVIAEPLHLGRALAMATLHDLPEGLTTDIPTPAWRFLPSGTKEHVERAAMKEILGAAAFAPALLEYWEELQRDQTAEAHLVHDADKLDLYLQALVYEMQTGNRQLAEFWATAHAFHFPQAAAILEAIQTLRMQE